MSHRTGKDNSSAIIDSSKATNDNTETNNDNNNDVHQRFWGVPRIVPQKSATTFMLERTELHVTQVAIAELNGTPSTTASLSSTDSSNSSMLYASTKLIKDIPVCTLSLRGPRHCLVDLNFFPHDESVTFRVEGNLPLALAGTIAIFGGQLLVSDDEEEEESRETIEDNEEDGTDEEQSNEENEELDDDEEEEEEEIPVPKPSKSNNTTKPLTATEKLLKRKREEQEQQQQQQTISTSKGTTIVQATSTTSKDNNKQNIQQNKKRKDDETMVSGKAANTASKEIASPSSVSSLSSNENIKSLANGKIRYIDLAQGTGNIATKGQRVTVAYEGRLKNGKVFDKGNKFTFRLGDRKSVV